MSTKTTEREDPVTGRRTLRMRVPYLGFSPAPSPETTREGV